MGTPTYFLVFLFRRISTILAWLVLISGLLVYIAGFRGLVLCIIFLVLYVAFLAALITHLVLVAREIKRIGSGGNPSVSA